MGQRGEEPFPLEVVEQAEIGDLLGARGGRVRVIGELEDRLQAAEAGWRAGIEQLLIPFFSTKDVGPIVLEISPADTGSITGTIMDCWQMALEDVGPAGVDKGRAGQYLILPPTTRVTRWPVTLIRPGCSAQ